MPLSYQILITNYLDNLQFTENHVIVQFKGSVVRVIGYAFKSSNTQGPTLLWPNVLECTYLLLTHGRHDRNNEIFPFSKSIFKLG